MLHLPSLPTHCLLLAWLHHLGLISYFTLLTYYWFPLENSLACNEIMMANHNTKQPSSQGTVSYRFIKHSIIVKVIITHEGSLYYDSLISALLTRILFAIARKYICLNKEKMQKHYHMWYVLKVVPLTLKISFSQRSLHLILCK